jgi:hypothetical protein
MKVKLIHTETDPVRLSFPDVFEAVEYEAGDGKPRYNATFLVKKGGENDKRIRAAIATVADEAFGKSAQKQLAAFEGNAQKMAYLDGDLKEYDGYADHWYLSCHRKEKDGPPTIIDRNKEALTSADGKPYAGCFVNATVDIWAQVKLNPGIRASFSGVQFVRDGDAFGGGRPASTDEFDDLGVPAEGEAEYV